MAAACRPAVRLARRCARPRRDRAGRDALTLFRREGTEINPVSTANRKLIVSGPFTVTRNPMYLGLVLVTLGTAFRIGAWPMLLAPVATFATANRVHIPFEEAKMRRRFGETFDAYTRRVRRWV